MVCPSWPLLLPKHRRPRLFQTSRARHHDRSQGGPEGSPEPREQRPHLLLSVDQGSDGLSGSSYLRSVGLNLSVMPDPSHGNNNDFLDTLRDQGLFKFWVLMLIPMNVEHGPWLSDLRYNQVRQSWAAFAQHAAPERAPLFLDKADDMLQECGGESALMADLGHDDVERALWDRMLSGWAPKGAKVNLYRFHDSRRKAGGLLTWWSATLCKHEFVAMEQGLLAGRNVAKLIVREEPAAAQEGQKESSTNSARVCLSERAIRGCCNNSLVISCMMLGDRWHYYLVKVIVVVSLPLSDWHYHMNHEMRSSDGAHRWLVNQLQSGFGDHLKAIFERASDLSALQECGLAASFAAGGVARAASRENDALQDTEDLANLFGEMTLTLGSRRLARCSYMVRGWPIRMAGICGGLELQRKTMDAFEQDYRAFMAMKARQCKSSGIMLLENRSAFNDVSVQQYVKVALVCV